MNDLSFIQTIIQGGAVAIAVYLIWQQDKERARTNAERQEERELWYSTVTNHMSHDTKLHEKQIKTLQKLCDVVSNLADQLKRK